MNILLYSLITFKIKFVRKNDLPHSDGPVMIHLTGWFGYRNLSIVVYLLLNKSFINVYTIKLNKHKNDRPQGIVRCNDCIISSIVLSLFVQLVIVILIIIDLKLT